MLAWVITAGGSQRDVRVWRSVQSWSPPQPPPRLLWFHPRDSSGAGNKHQCRESQNKSESNRGATKQQADSCEGCLRACQQLTRPSSYSVRTETCHSAEDADNRREQQTASHPYTTAAALIRIWGASRNHNNEGN